MAKQTSKKEIGSAAERAAKQAEAGKVLGVSQQEIDERLKPVLDHISPEARLEGISPEAVEAWLAEKKKAAKKKDA